jgi:hypothetical protein
MTLDTQLGTRRFEVDLPLAYATASTTGEDVAFRAPIRMTVTKVTLIAKGAITGHGSAYSTLSLQNKGGAGHGDHTTEIASFAFDTPTTDDVAAFTGKDLTLSGTAANLVLASGDVVSVKKAVATTGIALSGKVIIEAVPAGS